MDKKPAALDLAKIDAAEFDRLKAEGAALERDAESEREEQARREALEKAWRDQEQYTHAVAELKDKEERRMSLGSLALRLVLVAVVLGTVIFLIFREPVPEQMSESDALRIASEARLRREEEARAKLAATTPAKEVEPKLEAIPPAPVEDSIARARAAEEAKKAEDKTRALALQARIDERNKAELEAKVQAQAMVQAEERARTVSAAAVNEAPRAATRPGSVFQDCADCPRMVAIPVGEFTMGSPAAEAGRGLDEGPQRQVSIAQAFALGRSEVTVAEFRRFVDEAGYKTEAERDTRAPGCSGFVYADPAAGNPAAQVSTSWRSPGLAQAQADPHPVLCVSWNDARAYAQWLSKKAGKRFRLPTEAEWEYAARAGSSGARFWGDDPAQACRYANVADQSRFQLWGFGQKHECTDGHYFTAPAGGYAPNRFGLYDILGNVWEWTEDCWNSSYAGAPSDGTARLSGDCTQRVVRGGSWSSVPRFVRSATRHRNPADYRDNLTGFRLARTLD
jgi:formylglycine-generating enzyme required for sulfatase activity